MATGKWQVFSNIFNGVKKYRVGRQLRENEPLHSGNILYVGGFFPDEAHAQEQADKFNNYDGVNCPMGNDMFCCDCALIQSGCECPFKE